MGALAGTMIIMVYNNFETIDCATNARLLVGVGVGLGCYHWSLDWLPQLVPFLLLLLLLPACTSARSCAWPRGNRN